MVAEKLREMGGLFIFALFVAIISIICFGFDIKEALPAFMASLFFLYVLPESPYSKLKNVLGSYIVASVFGFLGIKILAPKLVGLSALWANVILATVVTFFAGFVLIILSMEHPPAIAILADKNIYTKIVVCS